MADHQTPADDLTALDKAFSAMLIAEVVRHGGVPQISPEELHLRETIAALLRAREEPPVALKAEGCRACDDGECPTHLGTRSDFAQPPALGTVLRHISDDFVGLAPPTEKETP